MHRLPIRSGLELRKPALNIGIVSVVELDHLTKRHHPGAQIIGKADWLAANIGVRRADQIRIENRKPFLATLTSPSEEVRLLRRIGAAVIR